MPSAKYARKWRKKKQLELRNKEKNRRWVRFLASFWDVAGKFFAVKSSLNPLVFCSYKGIIGDQKVYAQQGYRVEQRKQEPKRFRSERGKNGSRIKSIRRKISLKDY